MEGTEAHFPARGLSVSSFPEGDIPDLDLPLTLVAAASRQPPAIRAECHTQDRASVAMKGAKLLTGRHLPDPHHLVPATRGNPLAICTERDAAVSAGLPFERAHGFPRYGVPDEHTGSPSDVAVADGGQQLAVGAEC